MGSKRVVKSNKSETSGKKSIHINGSNVSYVSLPSPEHKEEEIVNKPNSSRKGPRSPKKTPSKKIKKSPNIDEAGPSFENSFDVDFKTPVKPPRKRKSNSTKKNSPVNGTITDDLNGSHSNGEEGESKDGATKSLFPRRKKEKNDFLSQSLKPSPKQRNKVLNEIKAKAHQPKSPRKKKVQWEPKIIKDDEQSETSVSEESKKNSIAANLAGDVSITTLSNLIRDKRIRPPYGQPYSVTGSWYIATGYLKDLTTLMDLFEKKETERFKDYAACWQEMQFTQIFRGRQSFKELLEFSEELVILTKKFLEEVHSDKRRIGALYTLYSLYYKHPVRRQFVIRFTPSQFILLNDLVKQQPHLTNPDPARIFLRLLTDSAIHHVATDTEMCIGLHSKCDQGSVELEYGYLRLAQSSNVPRALPKLEFDDKFMEMYHNSKIVAGSESSSAPDKALNMFNSGLSKESYQQLESLKDFTLNQLSFRGKHAIEDRLAESDDPVIKLGTKRYDLKKRAVSIAAAELQQQIEDLQNMSQVASLTSDEAHASLRTLSMAGEIVSRFKATKYVGKMDYKLEKEDEGTVNVKTEPVTPSKQDNIHGITYPKKGRPVKYMPVKEKTNLTLPVEAMSMSVAKKIKREQVFRKIQEKDTKVNFNLVSTPINPSNNKIKPETQKNKKNVINLDSSATIHKVSDGMNYTLLVDSVADTEMEEFENVEVGTFDEAMMMDEDIKPSALLEMRIAMKVNGKREERVIKASVSPQQFEDIRNDQSRLVKLHQKLLTLIKPQLQSKYGRDCVITDLFISKVNRCEEKESTESFITGNQPFVQSGKCNLKRRMKVLEMYRKKMVTNSEVEEIDSKQTRAAIKLLPIIVGGSVRYIQSSASGDSENSITKLPSSSKGSNPVDPVLRFHNCDWNSDKKVTSMFKNFKTPLNNTKVEGEVTERIITGGMSRAYIYKSDGEVSYCKQENVENTNKKVSKNCSVKVIDIKNSKGRKKEKKTPVKALCENAEADENNAWVTINQSPAIVEKSPIIKTRKEPKRLKTTKPKVKSNKVKVSKAKKNNIQMATEECDYIDIKEELIADFDDTSSEGATQNGKSDKFKVNSSIFSRKRKRDNDDSHTLPKAKKKCTAPSVDSEAPRLTRSKKRSVKVTPEKESESPVQNAVHDADEFDIPENNSDFPTEPHDFIETDDVMNYDSFEEGADVYHDDYEPKVFHEDPLSLTKHEKRIKAGFNQSNVVSETANEISSPSIRTPQKILSSEFNPGTSYSSCNSEFVVRNKSPEILADALTAPNLNNSALCTQPTTSNHAEPQVIPQYDSHGQSFIRAITAEGGSVFLPMNTYFSIVQNDGSETNSTHLDFTETENPIMLSSQTVMAPVYHLPEAPMIPLPQESFQYHMPVGPEGVVPQVQPTDCGLVQEEQVEFSKEDLMASLHLAKSPVNDKSNPLVSPMRRSRRLGGMGSTTPKRSKASDEPLKSPQFSSPKKKTDQVTAPSSTISKPAPSPPISKATPSPTISKATPSPTISKATPSPTISKATPSPTISKATPSPTISKATPSPTISKATPSPTTSKATPSISKPAPSTISKATPSISKATPSPISKATPSPISKPTPSSISKPTPSSISKATPSSISKATPSSISKATPSSISKATPSPISKPTPSPYSKAIQSPISKAAPSPVSKPTPSISKPTAPPIFKVTSPISKPTPSPISKPTISADISSSKEAPVKQSFEVPRKPVCNFLLNKRFMSLKPVLGNSVKGEALGTPSPSQKRRVSFFKKGKLK